MEVIGTMGSGTINAERFFNKLADILAKKHDVSITVTVRREDQETEEKQRESA